MIQEDIWSYLFVTYQLETIPLGSWEELGIINGVSTGQPRDNVETTSGQLYFLTLFHKGKYSSFTSNKQVNSAESSIYLKSIE